MMDEDPIPRENLILVRNTLQIKVWETRLRQCHS